MLEKKCRKCRQVLSTQMFHPDQLGRYGVASTCKSCKSKSPTSTYNKIRRGTVQMTDTQEKKKAFERDGKCIIQGCPVRTYSSLDFHHVYWKTFERIYGPERNKADKGVMLCRRHHQLLTDGDVSLDQFARLYLAKKSHEIL